LPFNDGSVDLVWSAHSMQSYPDIRKVLTEFRRVLRPDGLLAVLESDNLHAVMLSWPPDLELALLRAEHREIGDEDTYFGTYFPRFAPRLLDEAGLLQFQRKQFLVTRFGPATGPLRKFVELYLRDLIDRIGNLLSDAMRSRLERLSDPNSNEFLPRQADFSFSTVQTLILGRGDV
jgi:ubiquinone/menaquinone biosynthesis C-methylase UbiE